MLIKANFLCSSLRWFQNDLNSTNQQREECIIKDLIIGLGLGFTGTPQQWRNRSI